MATFGQMLKRFRERKGYDKKGLAEAIRVDRGRIAAWENGTSRPRSRAVLQDLSEALDLSVQETAAFGDAYHAWGASSDAPTSIADTTTPPPAAVPSGPTITTSVNTGGGDYAEGNIDKRQGAFVSGGIVQGNVVGTNLGTVTANYYSQQAPPVTHALHQLRAPVADFIGREREIDQLVQALSKAASSSAVATISSVRGMGGNGKSELAYVVANRLKNTFPDAQLLVELRGASSNPLTPEQVLQTVIRAFEREAKLPDDLSQLKGLYNSVLAGRRVLILADDARDMEQVRSLLPPQGCSLLVTSRNRFSLPGMMAIDLEMLPPEEAEKLLLRICPRIGSHANELAKLCAYLPLGLRVSASLLKENDSRNVARYLEELRAERLTHLKDPDNPDDPQASVEASLRLSYEGLDYLAHLALWQFALYPLGMPRKSVKDAILMQGDALEIAELLRRRNLLKWEAQAEEYHLHDLVREFALERGIEFFSEWVALARSVRDFRAEQAALSYLSELYNQKGDLHTAATLYNSWAKVSGWIGDIRSAMGALQALGSTYEQLGQDARAIDSYERVLFFARKTNDLLWQESALDLLLRVYHHQGEQHKVIEMTENMVALARSNGDREREARGLENLSTAFENQGDTDAAIEYTGKAWELWEALENRRFGAIAGARLSRLYEHIGNFAQAAVFGQQWLDFVRETTLPEHRAAVEVDLKKLEERQQRLTDATSQTSTVVENTDEE